jgi:hypothetical protein
MDTRPEILNRMAAYELRSLPGKSNWELALR